MRKKMKHALAVCLSAAMILGLAACGEAPAQATTQATTEDATTDATAETASETPAERQTISFAVLDVNAGVNNVGDNAEEIVQKIRDYCNVDVELQWVANDALAEKNSLFLASPKTMPNIMSWGGSVTGDVVSAAKNGAFVDLNEYIWDAEKYPNLSGMSKEVANSLTVGGQMIAIPRGRTIARYGLSYRQDWAEKLGVELPENATPDDVYNMLYAFTYNDPDGNGVDDTIGMEMTSYTGPFDIIQTWFGCGNGWQEVNGELVPVWATDEYFEAVEFIKKLYDDGLMPADWASRPTDSWSNGCKTGENGVYIDVMDGGKRIWKYFEAEETLTPSVVDETVPATMNLYGAVNGHTLATAGYNGFFTLSATTLDTPEKIEAALTLLDKLNDPEMLVLTQCGLEGINYEMKDGYISKLDAENETLANNYKGLNQLLAYMPNNEATAIPTEPNKYDTVQNEVYVKSLPFAEINPALSYLVESDTYSAEGKTLDDEATALRTQYICGAISLDNFKAGLDAIKANGYEQIIAEVNAAFNSNK